VYVGFVGDAVLPPKWRHKMDTELKNTIIACGSYAARKNEPSINNPYHVLDQQEQYLAWYTGWVNELLAMRAELAITQKSYHKALDEIRVLKMQVENLQKTIEELEEDVW
jgi:ubiquinone biosynthesis protein UbiJ